MEEKNFSDAELAAAMAEHDGLPASGVITGLVLGMAASLLAVAADQSREAWPGAPGAVAQARALQRRANLLARNNSRAYESARAALSGSTTFEGAPEQRDWTIGRVVAAAADAPFALAACADDVATLALTLATHGAPEIRADVVAAAQLAAGAAASAAHLVEVNLVVGADEVTAGHARRHARSAAEAARSAATT